MNRGRGDEEILAAGGSARHVPVLRDEVLAALSPQTGGLYLDATFGAGGYTRALLALAGTRVLALDRDPTAIAAGAGLVHEFDGRLILEHAHFASLDRIAARHGLSAFDGVVFDIGVSSMQIDEAARGFSFRQDGPLDMRMDCEGPSAADIVNTAEEATLADIFYYFGEERAARRIARAILRERAHGPFTSTLRLAETIARANPGRPGEIDPATRSFQALRIAVNDELGEFVHGLVAAESVLRPGGRLAAVTFHSLEDRIAKQFFGQRSGRGEARSRLLPGETARPESTFELVGKQPVTASPEETARNPRARSAKLRVGQRTAAAPQPAEDALLMLAGLPHAKKQSAAAPGAGKRPRRC
ncbi:MAG: 16S rRNA (cytosine(1402)-N(4))-methyltransferase RsmH [Beijerinckiaceae bacterium]